MSLTWLHSSAVQALDSRVTTAENSITTQQSAITKLQGDLTTTNANVAKKAEASALTALISKVTSIDGRVTTQSTQITNLDNKLTLTNNNLADAELIARLSSQGKALRDDPTFKGPNNVLVPYVLQSGATLVRQVKSADNPTGSTHEYLLRATTTLGSISSISVY